MSASSNNVPQETTTNNIKDATHDIPPKATIPPTDDDFFRTFRRFTDYHITSMMHSFFGLPTIFSPPPSSGWMVFEEGTDGSWRRPDPNRILSELEMQKKEGQQEGETDAERKVRPARFYILRDPFGFGPESFRVAGMNSSPTIVPLPPQSVLEDPSVRDAFFQHYKNQILNSNTHDPFQLSGTGVGSIEQFFNNPFFMGFPGYHQRSPFFAHPAFWGLGMGFPYHHHHHAWEMPPPGARRVIKDSEERERGLLEGGDVFKQLGFAEEGEKAVERTGEEGRRLVSTTASTVSTLGADGIMHTKYALRKRYSDGTEQVEEREYEDKAPGPLGLLRDGEARFKSLTKESEDKIREWAHEGERAWKLVWDKGKEVLEELKKGPGDGGRG